MKAFLLCLYLISALTARSQTDEIDSLRSIIISCQPLEADSCKAIVQKLIESAKNGADKRLYPNVLMYAGKAYLDNGELDKGEQLLLQAKSISDSLGARDILAISNKLLGIIARNKGDYEESLFYYFSAAEICEERDEKAELAKVYLGISSVFYDTDRLTRSQYYDSLVKDIAEDLNDDDLRLKAISNIALNSMHYGINYYQENITDTSRFQQTLDSLNIYFKKSETEFYEGLDLARKMGNQSDELTILNNLVALTLNMENNEKAIILAKESEILAEANGEIGMIVQSKFNMGSAYRRMGEFDKAAKYGEESLALAKKYALERKEYLANRTLYELYKTMEDYGRANQNLEEMAAYDKKIANIESNKVIAELEAIYQNTKKEKEILGQQNSILELAADNARIAKQRTYILGGSLGLMFLGFFGFRFLRVNKERNEKMAFAEALIFAQEEERKRIGQDLHDGVGQSLLLIKKQVLKRNGTNEGDRKLIIDALEEVRAISRDLHPFQLKQFGLNAAVKDMLSKVEKSSGLFISKELLNMDGFVSRKSEIHIYRTIQEALNNVVKHAHATALKISVQLIEGELLISIKDNGKGFANDTKHTPLKSLGLRTMSERMASIGGKVSVESSLSSGTTITLFVPKS